MFRNRIYLIYMFKEDFASNKSKMVDRPWDQTKLNNMYLIYMYKEDLPLNSL